MSDSNPMADRARKAAKIAENPTLYKVCEGCESIVLIKAITCPNCHGYRFDNSPKRVSSQALILGSRPPTTLTPEDFD